MNRKPGRPRKNWQYIIRADFKDIGLTRMKRVNWHRISWRQRVANVSSTRDKLRSQVTIFIMNDIYNLLRYMSVMPIIGETTVSGVRCGSFCPTKLPGRATSAACRSRTFCRRPRTSRSTGSTWARCRPTTTSTIFYTRYASEPEAGLR